ncbi:hypothetical protein MBLNU457_3964t1 [Dothideomycetes sp. NU457]
MEFDKNLPYSDLTVVCSGKSFKVHKIKLYEHSDWFKAALTSGFQEGTAATITLEEDDSELVEAMLKHCYRQSYEDIVRDAVREKQSGTYSAKMFCLADKYQCRPLAVDIASYLEGCLESYIFNGDDLLECLDVIYDLPTGSLVTVFQDAFRRAFVEKLVFYLDSKDFQELYQRRVLLASDCLDIIRKHYHPRNH